MRLFALLLVLVICYLSYDVYFGRNGVVQQDQMQKKLVETSAKTKIYELRNQALQDEITDLKQGNHVIEELARSELGMIKPDEQFYRVIDKSESKK